MYKQLLLLVACIGLNITTLYAQIKIELPSKEENISPRVKMKIEAYAKEIYTLIQQEKKIMKEELRQAKAEVGDTPPSREWKQTKAQIAEKHANIIDEKIKNLDFDLDEMVKKQVRYALLNSDSENFENIKSEIYKSYRPENSLSPYISFGGMIITNHSPHNLLDENYRFSSNLEVGFHRTRQFSPTSPWALTSGLGLSWRTIRLGNNKMFSYQNNHLSIINSEKILSKSKLRTGYVIIPLGLTYSFAPLEVSSEGIKHREFDEGFRIGAQLYGGIKLSSNNIIKGEGIKIRDRGEYYANPLIYGLQLTFTYDNLSIFIRRDFSNLFKDEVFPHSKMLQIGISLN